MSAEVAGKIEVVNFDVDDFVKQGEVVLRIRDREYVAQQKQASAAVDEAKANLQDMRLAFKRNEGLRKQKLISQAVYDKSSANLQAAAVRARPITLTAIMGAFFILDDPIFNGLAIALIFGILISTMLTLVVIPVLYYALKQRELMQRHPAT